MIEVIYDKDKEKDKQESNEKNEHEVSVNLRLPKNIRQIGSPDGHKRIYMEDYVVTYLNYIARPGSTQARRCYFTWRKQEIRCRRCDFYQWCG